ncbi:hypothetical protein Pfo_011942 [Paulownia fortunei]|nr:hypothetical protein Pfo_011942 [Paulownia fortunei]
MDSNYAVLQVKDGNFRIKNSSLRLISPDPGNGCFNPQNADDLDVEDEIDLDDLPLTFGQRKSGFGLGLGFNNDFFLWIFCQKLGLCCSSDSLFNECEATLYGEVVQAALCRTAGILADIAQLLKLEIWQLIMLVFCSAYMIMIGDVMSWLLRHIGVFYQWLVHGVWDHRKLVILVVVVLFLAPLCALDKIDSLSLTLAASVALAVVFVIVAFVVAAIELDTQSDVLTNFNKDLGIRFSTALNYIVRIVYVFHLVLVFPVTHFSLRQTVDTLFFEGLNPLSESRKRCLALTAVLFGLIYLSSTAVSFGCTFPSLIALRSLSWLMLMLVIIVSIVGVIGNIYGI